MLKKINCYIFLVIIAIGLTIGLILKHSHKNIKDDIEDFYIGLIDKNLVHTEINMMKQSLHNSNYILLVTCKDDIEFDFSFGSQKVRVDSIIKGNDIISEGDIIDIINITLISIPEIDQPMKSFNINFVNKLKTDSHYIVFLDECIKLNNKRTVFTYNNDYFMSPYFSVNEINASPLKSELSEGYFCKYGNVKNQDVFMLSSESIQQWEQFRKEIIETYIQ